MKKGKNFDLHRPLPQTDSALVALLPVVLFEDSRYGEDNRLDRHQTLHRKLGGNLVRNGSGMCIVALCLVTLMVAGCADGIIPADEHGSGSPVQNADASPPTFEGDAGHDSVNPDESDDNGGSGSPNDAGLMDDAGLVEDAGAAENPAPMDDGGLNHDAEATEDAGSADTSDPPDDTGTQEDAGSSEPPPVPWKQQQLEASNQGLEGIVSYVASRYQSCAPLIYLDETPTDALIEHFELPGSHTVEGACVDRRNADFRYLSFVNGIEDVSIVDGEYSLDPNAGRLGLFEGEIDSFLRVHCSGALAGTMAAGDMKYHAEQTDQSYSPSTSELEELIEAGDHCFFSPTITRDFSLLPGDIINVSSGHAVRVYQIGEDPLGLGQVESVDDCDDIRKRDLDFHFVHSTSNDFYSGVHFMHTGDRDTPRLLRNLVTAVREACREGFNDGDINGVLPHLYLGDREYLGGLIVREQHFRVLRHVGSQVPECMWEPPVSVRGEGCLQATCFEEVAAAGYLPPAN